MNRISHVFILSDLLSNIETNNPTFFLKIETEINQPFLRNINIQNYTIIYTNFLCCIYTIFLSV